MDERWKVRRERLRRIAEDCRQSIVDVAWWNENRADKPPMDCESERLLKAKAEACIAAIDAGDAQAIERTSRALTSYADSIIADQIAENDAQPRTGPEYE